MCTAMLYDPGDHYEPKETTEYFQKKSKVFERLQRIKQNNFLKRLIKRDKEEQQGSGGGSKNIFRHFFNL